MAKLYDILKNNELSKYPPPPQWVLDAIKVLSQDKESLEYFEFTNSILFDPSEKKWTMSTEQQYWRPYERKYLYQGIKVQCNW